MPTTNPDPTDAAGGGPTLSTPSVPERMRTDLTIALRGRDQVAIRALRTALAAFANAEAPPVADVTSSRDEPEVGRLVEHDRLVLAAADIDRILRHEIADRQDTVEQFLAVDRPDEAAVIRAELEVLAAFLDR